MKKSKFVYILVFVLLLLLCSLGLGIYSQVIFYQINKTINSPEIIDIAVNSIEDVIELMDRSMYFRNIRNVSFICAAVFFVAAIILIVAYTKGDAIKAKFKSALAEKNTEKSPKPKKIPKYSPDKIDTTVTANIPGQKGYCQNCGKFYDSLPTFCGECGENTT